MARKVPEAMKALSLCIAAGCALVAQEDPKATGPTTLVIEYRCAPAQRAKLRQYMRQAGLKRFEDLRANGALSGYHVLFSRYVDTNNWDMMAVLRFRRYEDVAQWKRVERETPAGLPAEMLELTTAIHTYAADLMRANSAEDQARQPVYLVIPYVYSVSTPEYLQYVDDYVRPQFDGWIREGILARYDVLLQRYSGVRPWDSLILLAYRDDASLGARERIVAKVRSELQSDPKWKALSDNKQKVRLEKEAIVADELAPGR